MAEGWVLPQAVEQLIQQICREQNQTPPGTEVRHELALLGEEEAVNLLRKIAASTIKTTLSAFIKFMIRKAKQPQTHTHSNYNNDTPSPQKVPRVSPLHSPSSPSAPASQSQSQSPTQGIDFTLHSLSLSLRCSWFDCYLFQIWFLFSLISKRGSQVFSLLGNFIG